MELDEMKNMWQKMDEDLQRNRSLNEQLIRHMIEDKSKNSIDKIARWEYANVIVCAALCIIFLGMMHRIGGTTELIVSYFFSFACIIVSLIVGMYNINRLSKLDMSSGSLTETATSLQRFQLLISKERIASLTIGPLLIAALLILAFEWVHHINILNHIGFYIHHVIIGTIAYLAAAIILYKKLYFNNIRTLVKNIEEIELFRKA